jgi:hypothetical protein
MIMDIVWAAITGAFSGLVQGFLSLFGMSDAQKLGRAEVTNADLKAEVKTQKEAINAQSEVDGMSNAAIDDRLRTKWERD